MPYQCRSLSFFIFMALILAAPVVAGKALEDRAWIEVQTANFQICSTLSKKKTVELAHHLELFRAAIVALTNVKSTDAPIPTKIYAMKKKKDFMKFGLKDNMAGVFLPGLRNNTILIRNTRGMAETSIIMHEYVHFLMRNNSAFHYPRWYDEGFAEYLGASEVKGKFLKLGIFPRHRINSLNNTRWIPIHKILTFEGYDEWSDEDQAMFYAEAWALVHYLLNQVDAESSFTQRLGQYLQSVESGDDDLEAFETAFGIEAGDLNTKVKRYVNGRLTAYRVKTDALLPEFAPKIKMLSREEASLGLAQLALQRAEFDLAEHWFTVARNDEATRPQAEAGLGDVLKYKGEPDQARIHFENAVALAPNDPYTQLDAAEYWHHRAQSSEEQDINVDYLDLARVHYVKAWKLDDTMPEIYAMYGQTFLTEGKDYAKAIEMLEIANELLPSNLDIRIMLALAYAGADRKQDAIEEARAVLAWSHANSSAARLAKEILAQMGAENSGNPQSQQQRP